MRQKRLTRSFFQNIPLRRFSRLNGSAICTFYPTVRFQHGESLVIKMTRPILVGCALALLAACTSTQTASGPPPAPMPAPPPPMAAPLPPEEPYVAPPAPRKRHVRKHHRHVKKTKVRHTRHHRRSSSKAR